MRALLQRGTELLEAEVVIERGDGSIGVFVDGRTMTFRDHRPRADGWRWVSPEEADTAEEDTRRKAATKGRVDEARRLLRVMANWREDPPDGDRFADDVAVLWTSFEGQFASTTGGG